MNWTDMAHTLCVLHYPMATASASVKLANNMVPTNSSSGVGRITHFKNCHVPLPHPVHFTNHEYLQNKKSALMIKNIIARLQDYVNIHPMFLSKQETTDVFGQNQHALDFHYFDSEILHLM